MRPGDLVAWQFGGQVQVGAVDSLNADKAWIYRLVPPGRQTSRIVKPLAELTLIAARDALHPVLLRQALTALDGRTD